MHTSHFRLKSSLIHSILLDYMPITFRRFESHICLSLLCHNSKTFDAIEGLSSFQNLHYCLTDNKLTDIPGTYLTSLKSAFVSFPPACKTTLTSPAHSISIYHCSQLPHVYRRLSLYCAKYFEFVMCELAPVFINHFPMLLSLFAVCKQDENSEVAN